MDMSDMLRPNDAAVNPLADTGASAGRLEFLVDELGGSCVPPMVFPEPAMAAPWESDLEGPGDVATWSPTTAALIYVERDAILVDALATYDQVDALLVAAPRDGWLATCRRTSTGLSETSVDLPHVVVSEDGLRSASSRTRLKNGVVGVHAADNRIQELAVEDEATVSRACCFALGRPDLRPQPKPSSNWSNSSWQVSAQIRIRDWQDSGQRKRDTRQVSRR
jgi:hypothetical protein